MNTPSPLQPLGRLGQPGAGRSSFNIAVITIIALHAMFFGGLLLQGCKQKTETGLSDLAAGSAPTNALAQPGGLGPAYPDSTNFVGLGGPGGGLVSTSAPPAQPATNYFTVPTQPVLIEPPVQPAPTTTEYAVARGDTLAKIAKKHGVTLAQIEEANPNLDPKKLQINQKLQIPASARKDAASPRTDAAENGAAEAAAKVYAVKPGDTLTKIAKLHGVTTKELRAYNSLKTDRITVNQKLKIPPAKAAAPAPANPVAEPPAPAPAQPLTNPVTAPGTAAPPANPTGGAVKL